MEESSISQKLLINASEVKRVMFAEAGKDFVDFLFHLLSLPVAAIICMLQGQGMQGSLPNLFDSLENIDDDYIEPNKTKDTFLKSVVPDLSCATSTDHKNIYGCSKNSCPFNAVCVSGDPSMSCPNFHTPMTKPLLYVKPLEEASSNDGGGLVKGVVTYMVMDDLVVIPKSNISAIVLLSKLGIKDVGALEEKVVNFGIDEAFKLLKASLSGKNVLIEVFC